MLLEMHGVFNILKQELVKLQRYYDEKKLYFDGMMMSALNQTNTRVSSLQQQLTNTRVSSLQQQLTNTRVSSLQQQFAGTHVAQLGHIILIPCQRVLDDTCLKVRKQTPIPNDWCSNPQSIKLVVTMLAITLLPMTLRGLSEKIEYSLEFCNLSGNHSIYCKMKVFKYIFALFIQDTYDSRLVPDTCRVSCYGLR